VFAVVLEHPMGKEDTEKDFLSSLINICLWEC